MAKATSRTIDDSLLPPADTAENRLLRAIGQNDLTGFYNALAEKPQVNAEDGKPLRFTAITNNQLFMKELMLRGADIAHAVNELKRERGGITRKTHYDRWNDTTYTYKNKAEKKRYADIGTETKHLEDYQKLFISTVAPIESVQIQLRTLQELQELKAEMLTALHGHPLDKKPMPAPAALRNSGPPKTSGMQ